MVVVVLACSETTTGIDKFGDVLGPPSVAAGSLFSCALDSDREAYCWGSTAAGRLGSDLVDPTVLRRKKEPVKVSGGLQFAQIEASGAHACGLTLEGVAYCWGASDAGQLGIGEATACYRDDDNAAVLCSLTPAPVAGGHRFKQLALGRRFTCGLTFDGETYCWGLNSNDQLGVVTSEACPTGGSRQCSRTPIRVATAPIFTSIGLGLWSACGVTESDEVVCWGRNLHGVFGDGTLTSSAVPTTTPDWPAMATLSVGSDFSCGLTPDGAAFCSGNNGMGELGDGETPHSPVPVAVIGGHTFTTISSHNENSVLGHVCGVTIDGAAYCWGVNNRGQLGVTQPPNVCNLSANQFNCAREPVAVSGGFTFETVAVGLEHSCGRTSESRVYCWGRNDLGQLGNGTIEDRALPALVVIPE